MGRPSLGESAEDTKMLHVRVERSVLARIKAAKLAKESDAAFIREAVERELSRREKVKG